MARPVTVMIPVGPYPVHKRWLGECMASVAAQTLPPAEVLLIDDMADLAALDAEHPEYNVWRAPWRLGDVGAFNCGVALAKNDLVFMLSCDDTLEPDCLELCAAEYEKMEERDGYYWVGNHYMDGQPDQALPFSAAMVTKGLWRECGGFPVETTGCGGDAALISILLTHFPRRLVKVAGGKPLYNVRVHKESETANIGPWMGVMSEVRGLVTKLWKPPEWGRME
jgi:glycosyltransferase involved in cell wall biosynthesis